MGRISASGQDKLARADQLRAAIAILEQEIQQILAEGKVAPPGCRVMRYQVRRKKGCYWYYKLQALEPTFPTGQDSEKLSKYKHLGKAGSSAHIDAVIQVARRAKVDGLQRAINSLTESWLEVCFSSETDKKKPRRNSRINRS